jgi:hypothetical protein
MEFIDARGEVGDTEIWGGSAWSVPRAPYATIDRHVRAMYRSRKTSDLFCHCVLAFKRSPSRRFMLELRAARRVVVENKSARPEYGPVSLWWRLGSPLEWLMFKLGLWKYLR